MTPTRASSSPSHPTPTPARRIPPRLAAIHRAGPSWHILIADTDTPSRAPAIRHAGTVTSAEAAAALLHEHRPGLVLSVIPAAQTICRPATLPPSTAPAAALDALALLAEAELPASTPAHRRAGGVLPPLSAGAPSIPLLVAWPELSGPSDAADPDSRASGWVPYLVALAALARACDGASLALSADRATGAVAIVASGPAKAVARVLRADTSTDAAWSGAIADAATRTAHAVGLSAFSASASGDTTVCILDAEGAPTWPRSISGVRADATWLAAYGPALGAILAWLDTDSAAAPLLSLRPDAQPRSETLLARSLAWFSAPARAAAIIAACVALLLIVPWGVAAARASMLERRAGGASALADRLAAANKEVAFYDLLRARRWPMTKLLADVAGAAPVGIRLESIDLAPEGGSAASGLVLRGTSPSVDLVTEFTKNLADTRVFADVATPSITPESGSGGDGVTFQLQARVAAPLFKAKPAADFAQQTLAQRLYGDRAGEAAPDSESPDPPIERRTAAGDGRPDRTPSSRAPSPATSAAIPEPLTDEAIAKLDRVAAAREQGLRRVAATRQPEGSPERQRLEDEVAKLRAHIAQLRAGGSGGEGGGQ